MTAVNMQRCGALLALSLAVALCVCPLTAVPITSTTSTHSAPSALSPRVLSLMQSLTLEQKIGQMTQLEIYQFVRADNPTEVDVEKTRYWVNNFCVGSVLNSPSATSATANLTPTQWIKLVNDLQTIFINEGCKIPMIFGIDSVHGANYVHGAAMFPHNVNVGASFNREIARKTGAVTAKDSRTVGMHWNFAPILDLATNMIWPRIYETFGEDPYLTTEMGTENIIGQQGESVNLRDTTKIAATAKHYIGYGAQKAGLDRTGAWIPDRFLYEYYVPSFRSAIQRAKAATVMESYNEINGVPIASSKQYLQTLLREELGFTGLLVTDWAEIINLHEWHKIASSEKEATRISMQQTSIDMSMVPFSASFATNLIQLVRDGIVNASRVDESAARILDLKDRLGLLENPIQPTNPGLVGLADDYQLSLDGARESIVLTKNDNLLPLNPRNLRRIAVVGPTGNSLTYQSGGWTIHWQGANTDSEFPYGITIFQSLKNLAAASNVEVTFNNGCGITAETCDAAELNAAVDAARNSDVVVLCIGEPAYAEKPGDITDLALYAGQIELGRAIAATGTPVVLVILEGRPRLLKNLPSLSKAILMGFLPGPFGGQAIAEILLGQVNPSAKMSYSYPKTGAAIPLPYWRKNSENDAFQVEWEFGHGLSFTTFTYSNLVVSPSTVAPGGSFTISVDVANTGAMEGKEPVLVFITDEYRIITPENKRLRAFDKVFLRVGESKKVQFTLSTADLEFYGLDNKRTLESGRFIVRVGSQTADFYVA
eukprot:TRINITY_DN1195_c0_g1_i1.p1 TRINITY_DN1195_c0_g1~~TRINITY_DN1195_c0_g1_i1.p1  ORF type:complete len:770 (-),score=172.75 TRINITY_DN1195_c0_g1_i1:210-2519(-)